MTSRLEGRKVEGRDALRLREKILAANAHSAPSVKEANSLGEVTQNTLKLDAVFYPAGPKNASLLLVSKTATSVSPRNPLL